MKINNAINGLDLVDDVLSAIADKIVEGRKDDAIDMINCLRDEFEAQSAHEAHVKKHLDAADRMTFQDARDHHLVRPNYKRMVGAK